MVRMLVRAGADREARNLKTGCPALAQALYFSKHEEVDAEILQIIMGKYLVSVGLLL